MTLYRLPLNERADISGLQALDCQLEMVDKLLTKFMYVMQKVVDGRNRASQYCEFVQNLAVWAMKTRYRYCFLFLLDFLYIQ